MPSAYRAPFALSLRRRCLIDYILAGVDSTLQYYDSPADGGRRAHGGGTAEKIGLIVTSLLAVLDLRRVG